MMLRLINGSYPQTEQSRARKEAVEQEHHPILRHNHSLTVAARIKVAVLE